MNVTSVPPRSTSERVARTRLSEVLQPYWFLLPAAAYLAALLGYPLVRGILLNLTDTSLTNPYRGSFVGAENYSVVSSVEFWNAIRLRSSTPSGASSVRWHWAWASRYW